MHGVMSFVGFRRDQGTRSRTHDNPFKTRSRESALAQSKACPKCKSFCSMPKRSNKPQQPRPGSPITDGIGTGPPWVGGYDSTDSKICPARISATLREAAERGKICLSLKYQCQ